MWSWAGPWCGHLADSPDTSPCPAYIFSSSRTGAAARETRAPRYWGSPVKSALWGYHWRCIGCERCPMNGRNNHTTRRSGPPGTKNVVYSWDTHQWRLCACHPGNAALKEGDSKQREQLLVEDNFHKTMSIFNIACTTHVQQGSYPPIQSLWWGQIDYLEMGWWWGYGTRHSSRRVSLMVRWTWST